MFKKFKSKAADDPRDRTTKTSKTGGSTASSTVSSEAHKAKTTKAVHYGRAVFIFGLVVVATLLGWAAHYFLSGSETELAESQFITINERALYSAVNIAYRKVRTVQQKYLLLLHSYTVANTTASSLRSSLVEMPWRQSSARPCQMPNLGPLWI